MSSSKQLQQLQYNDDEDCLLFNHDTTEVSSSTTMLCCFIQWTNDHRCQFIPNSKDIHTQNQQQFRDSSSSKKDQQQNEYQFIVKDNNIYATKQQQQYQRQPKQLNRNEEEGYGTTTTTGSTSMWIQRLQKKWGWETFRKYDQYGKVLLLSFYLILLGFVIYFIFNLHFFLISNNFF